MMRFFGSLALAKAAYQAAYRGKSMRTLLAPIAPSNCYVSSPSLRFQIAICEDDCVSTDELPQPFQGDAKGLLSAAGEPLARF